MAGSLDTLYVRYTTDPCQLDSLLESVRRYALSIARKYGHPDAEDAAQQISVKAWRALIRFSRRSSFRSWVHGIAKRYLIDEIREAKRKPMLSVPETEETSTVIDEPPIRDFRLLPYRIHQIAVLLATGHTQAEAAESIGCSVRTLQRIVSEYEMSLESP